MKRRRKNSFRMVAPLLALAVSLSVTFWACSGDDSGTLLAPQADPSLRFGAANPALRAVMDLQDRHTPELMAIEGVVGTGTGLDESGKPVIHVFTARTLPAGVLPGEIDGIPVVMQVTGVFRAMKGGPPGGGGPGGGGGVDHQGSQTPPIQLGTSGGWRYDLANGFCCGGTLGALIQVGGQKRILSNYHVFEADIVNGGNGRTAQTGDPIIQPGLIDVGCNANNAQNVATLVKTSSLPGSNVDASSATVIPGMVDESGAILEIGTISSQTAAAFIGQDVKKSGRTTGLSRASVNSLNVTVSVAYDNECAGGAAFTKTYSGQIITTNRGSKFLAGGDSGSLMVEDVDSNPRAVGLLYAGSNTAAVANPIGQVLSFFNATMVGN